MTGFAVPLLPEPGFLALAAFAAFLVGLSKGGLANVGTAAVPIMALVMPPVAAAALLLPIYILSDMVGIWIYRRQFSARNLAILIPAAFGGIAFGWAIAARISDAAAALIVGGIGMGFCLRQWLRRGGDQPPRPADVPRGVFWGFWTGFTSFITHSGAATFQVYVLPQKLEKLVFAGTSTLLFASINLAKVLPYWHLQQMPANALGTILVLVPVAILGTLAGARIARAMPTALFFRFVQIGLFVVSARLIYMALKSMIWG